MHYVIKIICYAKNKKEARSKAEDILNNRLVGDGKPFDYGVFFDKDGGGMSGKDRWGNLPAVVKADSKEGKKLIDDGLKFTQQEIKDNLKKIRELLNKYSDEELIEEEVLNTKKKILDNLEDNKSSKIELDMFKYYTNCVGRYEGNGVYLYDNDGEGIRNTKHLKNVLNKWDSKDYEGQEIFVLPIDVHS